MAIDLILSDSDKARITAAVTAVELHSAGEIVTIIAPKADDYAEVAGDWAAFIAFLALAAYAAFAPFYMRLIAWVMGGWHGPPTPRELLLFIFVTVLIKYFATKLLLRWTPLRLWLTPRWVKRNRVRAQALMVFKVTTQQRTTGKTGILIYLSDAEHMAEIIADEGIHAKVPDSVWGDAMAALVAEVKQGRLADGMIAAIEQVGAVLAQHFPRDPNDVNEVPDRVIEL